MVTILRAAVCVLACWASTAMGQSIFIDFSGGSAYDNGPPMASLGSTALAAGETGKWFTHHAFATAIPAPGVTRPLVGTDGLSVAATLTVESTAGFTDSSSSRLITSGSTTGNLDRLLDDMQSILGGKLTYTFTGLTPGYYNVFVYAINPARPGDRTSIDLGLGAVSCGGSLPGGSALFEGVTHIQRLDWRIAPGQNLVITAENDGPHGIVNGMQLVLGRPIVTRLYVDGARPNDTGNGAAWSTAFKTLTAALAAADANSDVQEIWVASGTYTFPGTDKNQTYSVRGGLSLVGGLSPGATTAAGRTARSRLSGALGGGGSVYRLMQTTRVDGTTTRVDGFEFVSADMSPVDQGFSGWRSPANGRGAGIWAYNQSLGVTNCHFENLKARRGGAIDASGTTNVFYVTTLSVSDSEFIDCSANGREKDVHPGPDSIDTNAVGGAITSWLNESATIQRCRFLGCGAPAGGAVYVEGKPLYQLVPARTTTLAVTDSLFASNKAQQPIPLNGVAFNQSRGFISGSAVYANGPSVYMSGCTIAHNRTIVPDSTTDWPDTVTVGTIQIAIVWNGALVMNQWSPAYQYAYQIYDSIVWGNSWSRVSGVPSGVDQVLVSSTAVPSTLVRDTSVEPGGITRFLQQAGASQVLGLLQSDPLFLDPDGADNAPGTLDDDYRLSPSSTCLDSAMSVLSVPQLPAQPTDLAGNPRDKDLPQVANAGLGSPAGWRDRGALERVQLQCNRADIRDASGTGGSDGLLTGSDAVGFFQNFFGACTSAGARPCNAADIADASGTGAPDGALTGSDVVTFFQMFFFGRCEPLGGVLP